MFDTLPTISATLFGVCVSLAPFLLIGLFKDTLKGFLTILVTLVTVHVLVGLTTQAVGVFTYSVVMSFHVGMALVSIYTVYRYRHVWVLRIREILEYIRMKYTSPARYSSIFVLMVCLLLFLFIYFLRFNYSGPVDTVFGVKKVTHSSYTYPMYSDEWIGSSLVSYSIKEKSLPLVNPLNSNDPFINFLMATHSFFAEIILVLSLNPLTQYVHLADIHILFACIALYLIQRKFGVGMVLSSITSFSVVLITNSGNLPGIWYILPFIISSTCLLYGMLGYLIQSRYVLFVSTILSIVLYPPIVVFALPFIVGATYGKKIIFDTGYMTALRIGLIALLGIGVVLLFSLAHFSMVEILKRAFSFVVRNSLDSGKVTYLPWNVLPVILIPGALIGLYVAFKNKYYPLLLPVCTGIFFWCMYAYMHKVVIIEPSRIVVITSILLLVVSGIGMQYLWKTKLVQRFVYDDVSMYISYRVLLFIVLLFCIWMNIQFHPWYKSHMIVLIGKDRRELIPSPPVTRYITQSDIDMFQEFKEKRFISLPWKGLVLGVATHNIPLESKSSTLTNRLLRYEQFIKASCEDKSKLVRKYHVDFVYSTKIDCPEQFKLEKISDEGLVLYTPVHTK